LRHTHEQQPDTPRCRRRCALCAPDAADARYFAAAATPPPRCRATAVPRLITPLR